MSLIRITYMTILHKLVTLFFFLEVPPFRRVGLVLSLVPQ